jgi:hypothetical protein
VQSGKTTSLPDSASSGALASQFDAPSAAGAGAAAEHPCRVTRQASDGSASGQHEASSSIAVEAE